MNHQPRVWSLHEAKAKFSEVVRRAQTEGPQTVTVHGAPTAVITKLPTQPKDVSKMTGADFVEAMRKGPLFDFELPPRPLHWPGREFSFDEDEQQ